MMRAAASALGRVDSKAVNAGGWSAKRSCGTERIGVVMESLSHLGGLGVDEDHRHGPGLAVELMHDVRQDDSRRDLDPLPFFLSEEDGAAQADRDLDRVVRVRWDLATALADPDPAPAGPWARRAPVW
jgi:hypothetical protein